MSCEWLAILYTTQSGADGVMKVPAASVTNCFNKLIHTDWIQQEWGRSYYQLLPDPPQEVITWQFTEYDPAAIDPLGLAWLISRHDLTFRYSDDPRWYRSGQAALDQLHAILRAQPTLAPTFKAAWNHLLVYPRIIPALQSEWEITDDDLTHIINSRQ